MARSGQKSLPPYHLGIMMGSHLLWLGMVCLLGAWWGRLLLQQAGRIVELEGQLGLAADVSQSHWHKTQRMLFWESGTFFGLLLACSILLFWLYWRDAKRSRGIQAFFASVTHELRTPLTSIRLQAESIAESPPGSQSHLVRRLLEDSIRLEAQVERTLELARVEGGGPVYTQPLQIRLWLDRFIQSWGLDYIDHVDFKLSVQDFVIQADPSAIQIIFKNLIENAVRHSQKEKVTVFISARPTEKGVKVVLKDDGNGYRGDEKSLGKLFYKDSASPGTGVGLYLAKVLMKRMGGAVDFNLKSGFEISLFFLEGQSHG